MDGDARSDTTHGQGRSPIEIATLFVSPVRSVLIRSRIATARGLRPWKNRLADGMSIGEVIPDALDRKFGIDQPCVCVALSTLTDPGKRHAG